jgi:RHS repeat-associated protein
MVIDGVNTATPVLSAVHVDHLMRPIRITNSAKVSTWDATWLPWGGAHVTTGTTAMSLRFPGQYFLIEQGLAYNWHRMYDQSTGRYTQADPLGFPDGPARYAYAGNSPLMVTDPEGREIVWGPFGPILVPDGTIQSIWNFTHGQSSLGEPANDNFSKRCILIGQTETKTCPPQQRCQYQCSGGYTFQVTQPSKYQLCQRSVIDPR